MSKGNIMTIFERQIHGHGSMDFHDGFGGFQYILTSDFFDYFALKNISIVFELKIKSKLKTV